MSALKFTKNFDGTTKDLYLTLADPLATPPSIIPCKEGTLQVAPVEIPIKAKGFSLQLFSLVTLPTTNIKIGFTNVLWDDIDCDSLNMFEEVEHVLLYDVKYYENKSKYIIIKLTNFDGDVDITDLKLYIRPFYA